MIKLLKLTIAFFLLLITFKIPYAITSRQDVEVGFSPGKTAKQIVIMAIEEAKNSIDISAYSFTSKPIALALVDAKERGVNVRVVADKKLNGGKYTAITYLAHHHVPVKLNDKYAIMHNKFIIIDNNSVETGSFNYTQNAVSRNAENVIYLRNRPDIAKKYLQEFNRLWRESTY
ncbi:phospholipase D family nuclease [Candidatus Profftia sp. (ex Adelges kitamiensis)]|uniref:phospholipase D family nuclease n=1 Tax=Candidatus Profftia sp. (ex Adelges kitamiensis) TaxID=2864218 RepID=UPI001CE2C0CE|nr:phospholipase D family protein [Candidatus Profftia sp. (ex Adelges kitamiensis)]